MAAKLHAHAPIGIVFGALFASVLALPATARAEEILHAYTALDRAEAAIYFEAFTRDTGVPVRWVRMSSGETLARVRAERQRPQASVWYGGPSLEFTAAAEEDLLEPYVPTTFADFAPGHRDPQWRWCGMSIGILAFGSNVEVLARRGTVPPTTWKALLAPAYAGEVAMAYTYTSGTAYTVLATLAQMFGEDEALRYFDSLDENVHHYTRSGAACVTQVGLAEIGVCIAFAHDIISKGRQRGYPVTLTFPGEGTGFEVGSMALIRGGPEPQLARKFFEWSLSERAQGMLKGWHRLPIRPDVPRSTEIPPTDTLKVIDFDTERAVARRRILIEAWREVTGQ